MWGFRAIVTAVSIFFHANGESPLGLVGIVTNTTETIPPLKLELDLLPLTTATPGK